MYWVVAYPQLLLASQRCCDPTRMSSCARWWAAAARTVARGCEGRWQMGAAPRRAGNPAPLLRGLLCHCFVTCPAPPPPCAPTEQAGGQRGRQRHPSHPCDCAPAGGCHPYLRVAGQDEPAGGRGQATWYHTRRWHRWLGAGRGCGFAPLDGPLSAASIPCRPPPPRRTCGRRWSCSRPPPWMQ